MQVMAALESLEAGRETGRNPAQSLLTMSPLARASLPLSWRKSTFF